MMKKMIPYIVLVAVILAAALYLYYSGKSAGDWKAKFEQLKTDEAKIVKDKDDWIKTTEAEIQGKQVEIDKKEEKVLGLQVKAAQSDAKIAQRDKTIDDLNKKLKSIVVSSDPDTIISDLNKRGLSSIHRRRSQ